MYPYQQFKLTYPSQVTSSNANHLFLSSRVTCTPKSFKVVLKSSSENLVLSLANFSKKFLHDVMTSESSSCKWSTQLCEGFVHSFLFYWITVLHVHYNGKLSTHWLTNELTRNCGLPRAVILIAMNPEPSDTAPKLFKTQDVKKCYNQ